MSATARAIPVLSPIEAGLRDRVFGQDAAIGAICPLVDVYSAGLSPAGRCAGSALLLGPTGVGKTHFVESLADVIHGSPKNLIRIDCAEYQMDHEIAKLIGAPPGYLGHRETHPLLTQARLAASTSANSSLSIVLFDEFEKAGSSLSRLLLGVLDKAQLRLGDNNIVNFERSLLLFTSNCGSREMADSMRPMSFIPTQGAESGPIAIRALKKAFAPEFLNRIDATVVFKPLERKHYEKILASHIDDLTGRLSRNFKLTVNDAARGFLLEDGSSQEYGARELKRSVFKHLTVPLSRMVNEGMRDGKVLVSVKNGALRIERKACLTA